MQVRILMASMWLSAAFFTDRLAEHRALADGPPAACVTVVHREVTQVVSRFHGAIYADSRQNRLINSNQQSDDNGVSWQPLRSHLLLSEGLESRPEGDLIATYVRGLSSYKSREFALVRLKPSSE